VASALCTATSGSLLPSRRRAVGPWGKRPAESGVYCNFEEIGERCRSGREFDLSSQMACHWGGELNYRLLNRTGEIAQLRIQLRECTQFMNFSSLVQPSRIAKYSIRESQIESSADPTNFTEIFEAARDL
jgi:hypothetical protein